MRHANYWFETCSPKVNNSVGLIKNVDVLVIGGGLAGTSVLFQLIRGGVSNAYLIEENTVGYHASGRASGQLMLRGRDLFSSIADERGKDVAEEYLRFVSSNIRKFSTTLSRTKFDTDLVKSGGLRLATTPEELESLKCEAAFINERSAMTGVSCLEIDSKKLRSILPSRGFLGGLYVPCEGTVNPYKIVNGTRDLLEVNGPKVLSNSCVERVSRNEDGRLRVSVRHKGIILANKVVYATNAYTPSLLHDLEDQLIPVRGQMTATDVLSTAVLQALPTMSVSCGDSNDYFRVHNNRLLLGGQRQSIRGQQVGIINDGEISQTIFKRQKEFLNEHLPFLDTKFSHAWSGIMCYTKDGFPLVGELPNRPNEYVIAGFNGHGLSHTFLCGSIIKDYITKGKTNVPGAELFNPARITVK